jgi:hypothetical protein
VLDVAAQVLGAVRRQKTTQKRSMRARVATLTVTANRPALRDIEAAWEDIIDAGGVDDFVTTEDEESETLSVEVVLTED